MPPQDDETPKNQLLQGLGLLWKAARGAAVEAHKELEKSEVGKVIDDAGRELGRAVESVVTRLGAELRRPTPRPVEPVDRAPGHPQKGPTPDDPGFSIADPGVPPGKAEGRDGEA